MASPLAFLEKYTAVVSAFEPLIERESMPRRPDPLRGDGYRFCDMGYGLRAKNPQEGQS